MSFSRNPNSDSFKQQYQKSLQNNLLLHPKAIKARTINAINTINTNKSTIQKYNINYKPKNVTSKELYSKYKNVDFQEKHPFGVTDTKRYCHGTINTTSAETSRQLSQRDYRYPKHKDNLEGGIALFINDTSAPFSKRKTSQKRRCNSVDNENLKTERVINPKEDDGYFFEISGKKKVYQNGKDKNNCGIVSLINKTPANYFPVRGKRKVDTTNSSWEKNKKNLNTNCLFGVNTKMRIKGKALGYENKHEYSDLPSGRKHYYNKHLSKSIY